MRLHRAAPPTTHPPSAPALRCILSPKPFFLFLPAVGHRFERRASYSTAGQKSKRFNSATSTVSVLLQQMENSTSYTCVDWQTIIGRPTEQWIKSRPAHWNNLPPHIFAERPVLLTSPNVTWAVSGKYPSISVILFITLPPVSLKYYDQRVCLYVCFFVCLSVCLCVCLY